MIFIPMVQHWFSWQQKQQKQHTLQRVQVRGHVQVGKVAQFRAHTVLLASCVIFSYTFCYIYVSCISWQQKQHVFQPPPCYHSRDIQLIFSFVYFVYIIGYIYTRRMSWQQKQQVFQPSPRPHSRDNLLMYSCVYVTSTPNQCRSSRRSRVYLPHPAVRFMHYFSVYLFLPLCKSYAVVAKVASISTPTPPLGSCLIFIQFIVTFMCDVYRGSKSRVILPQQKQLRFGRGWGYNDIVRYYVVTIICHFYSKVSRQQKQHGLRIRGEGGTGKLIVVLLCLRQQK